MNERFRLAIDMTHGMRRELMNRGEFWHWHTWEGEEGHQVEYWRAVTGSGAVIRQTCESRSLGATFYQHAGDALAKLREIGCHAPGIPA